MAGGGLPISPPLYGSVWVLIAFGNQSMTLFGLSRFADLVEELQATREALADAEISRQRLAAASRLRTEIASRLRRVSSQVGEVLDATTGERMTALLRSAGQQAREASAQARLLARELPAAEPPDYRPSAVSMAPRLARAVTAAVLVLFAGVYLFNVGDTQATRPGLVVDLTALAVAVTVVGLQLHLVRFRDSAGKPRGWRWALGVQAVLAS